MAVITYPRRRQATAAGTVRIRAGWLLALLMASAVVLGLVSLTLTTLVTTRGYEVRRLQAERDRWTERLMRVESEISSLQSLERVEREARSRLRLTEARDRLFVNPKDSPPPVPQAAPTTRDAGPDPVQLLLDQLAWVRLQVADLAAGLP
jgi:cell division protein FtsB